MLRAALVLLCLTCAPASAQIMRQHSLICDLYVNDLRISWPPKFLDWKACADLRKDLEARDKTDADIECECETGSKT